MQLHRMNLPHGRLQLRVQLCRAQVVGGLKVQPGLGVAPKEAAQPQRRVGRDAAPLQHDVVHARGGNVQVPGQRVGAHVHGLQVVLAQDFTWVYGAHAVFKHVFLLCSSLGGAGSQSAYAAELVCHCSSVVIHYLYVSHSLFRPDKADAPLVVDADAVLALPISHEHFQAIARRAAQKFKCHSRIQLSQLALRHALDVGEPAGLAAGEQALGFRALEGSDRHEKGILYRLPLFGMLPARQKRKEVQNTEHTHHLLSCQYSGRLHKSWLISDFFARREKQCHPPQAPCDGMTPSQPSFRSASRPSWTSWPKTTSNDRSCWLSTSAIPGWKTPPAG